MIIFSFFKIYFYCVCHMYEKKNKEESYLDY